MEKILLQEIERAHRNKNTNPAYGLKSLTSLKWQ